MMLQHF
jgi:hypothetical protein